MFDGVRLGRDPVTGMMKYDSDAYGDMVGISNRYNTAQKIAKSKAEEQSKYLKNHKNDWFFNMDGKSTPYHEMGHIYAEKRGISQDLKRRQNNGIKRLKLIC